MTDLAFDFDLDHLFAYHPPPDEEAIANYKMVREAGKSMALVILEATPPGADRSAAIRKFREAVMTANAAIALRKYE